ncbi:MAG: hypothetical protein IMX01_05495 [Limnochordaceae bacterium]|nr:hypothetical protein [Limnochordaceae bacterium]
MATDAEEATEDELSKGVDEVREQGRVVARALAGLLVAGIWVWAVGAWPARSVALAAASSGAQAGSTSAASSAAGKQKLVVEVPADPSDQTVTVDQKAGTTVVQAKTGLITITYGKIRAFSSRLEYSQKTQKAVLTGNVQVIDGLRTITAERVDVDLREEQYTFTKSVEMVETEQATDATAAKAATGKVKLRLQADSLVYETRTNLARASGNVRVQEADRTSVSQKLTYDQAKNEIQLEGDVHVTTADGTMVASRVVINTESGQIQFYGPTTLQLDVATDSQDTKKS